MSHTGKKPPIYTLIRTAILGAFTASLTLQAIAQELPQDQEQFYPTQSSGTTATRWGVGLGASVSDKIYAGTSTQAHVIPLLMFENSWLSVAGLGVSVKLPSTGPFQFRLTARYAGGYTADDTAVLNGMQDRRGSLWVGPQATWRTGVGNLSAEWLGDALGRSNGQQLRVAFDHAFHVGGFSVRPRIAATWFDDKYVDYYYGVTQAEAAANRPAYSGKSSTDPEIGVRVSYALAPGQVISLDTSASHLGSGITNSPLVDRTNHLSLRLGYLYGF